jgi:hypothetical protein
MRVIGLDVHRTFAAVAVLDNTQLSHPGSLILVGLTCLVRPFWPSAVNCGRTTKS